MIGAADYDEQQPDCRRAAHGYAIPVNARCEMMAIGHKAKAKRLKKRRPFCRISAAHFSQAALAPRRDAVDDVVKGEDSRYVEMR